MNAVLRAFLFEKAILVSDAPGEHPAATIVALAKAFGIKITSGHEYANESLIHFAADMLGQYVPEPFYRGFPDSVRKMSIDQRLFDQLVHYTVTYGFGMTDEAGHSIFERDLDRLVFSGDAPSREFSILTEEQAIERLGAIMDDVLLGTRPLATDSFEALLSFIRDHGYTVKACASKDTLCRLLLATGNIDYADTLWLSDVIKLLDWMQFERYDTKDLKKLNLKNRDRVLLGAVLDRIFALDHCNFCDCFEKKKIFAGLLHHIHYKPKTEKASEFLALMRGKENRSVYSEFERAVAEGDIPRATAILVQKKGRGALMRHLNYLASRAKTKEDLTAITDALGAENPIVMIQLLMQYANYVGKGTRTFTFNRHGMMTVHKESEDERARRRSILSKKTANALAAAIRRNLKASLKGRLGKVYIHPDMYRIAIPLNEATTSGGFGTLPRGSRIPLAEEGILRAFTYWEGVDDIDLAVIGLEKNGTAREFSWRTMFALQSTAITYSGDETSGYHGGSEYFDINLGAFRKEHPDIANLILCNNVFSGATFAECTCRAGYMIRKEGDGGEIYEPKTVRSAFTINCKSTAAFLFGIDLAAGEFVWLNTGHNSYMHIAALENPGYLLAYFSATRVLSLGDLFKMLAKKVVNEPMLADIALSDVDVPLKDGARRIASYDTEAILALLN